jgi:hypothetical protein
MEDVLMIRALKKVTTLHLLPEAVRVSSQRWRRFGVVGATVRNWVLLARFLSGTPPAELARSETS